MLIHILIVHQTIEPIVIPHIQENKHITAILGMKIDLQKKKKRNPLQALISFSLLCIMMFTVMPFAFNNITKSIFVPTPYKNVETDLRKLAFPTQDYISNAWFLGERSF